MRTQEHHKEIARLLKELRRDTEITQEQLASELNTQDELRAHNRLTSRFAINRIEKGHAALGPPLAAALDAFAVSKDIATYQFSSLVAELKAYEIDRERGNELSRLMDSRDLDTVFIVICDFSDFAYHIRNSLPTPRLRATVVVPSGDRINELFGAVFQSGIREGQRVFEEYGTRLAAHTDQQIQHLYRLAGQSTGLHLEIFESDVVLNSVVVARGGTWRKCLYWPCAPFGGSQIEPDLIPVVGSADVASWYESMIAAMIDTKSGVARMHHLGDVFLKAKDLEVKDSRKPSPPSILSQVDQARFSKFYPRRVPRRDIDGTNEGKAISLLLPYVRGVRGGVASIDVLLRNRSNLLSGVMMNPLGKLSFISAPVCVSAMFDSLASINRDSSDQSAQHKSMPTRNDRTPTYEVYRRKHLEEQAREMVAILDTVCRSPNCGEVPAQRRLTAKEHDAIDTAYKIAMSEELHLAYGLAHVDGSYPDRMNVTEVRDFRVGKEEAVDIFPRLFTLEISPEERDIMLQISDRYIGNDVARFTVDQLIDIMDEECEPAERKRYSDCLWLALNDEWLSPKFRKILQALR